MVADTIQSEAKYTMTAFTNYLNDYFSRPGSLSQREVADRAGIHFVNLNRIVRGHQVPSLTTAEAIANATGSNLGRILKNSEKRELVSA